MSPLSQAQRYWLALWLVPGVGPKRIDSLVEHVGSIEQIFGATHTQLVQAGLPNEVAAEVLGALEADRLTEELELIEQAGVSILERDDPDFSQLLSQIIDPPPVLYYKGQLDFNQPLHLAFVGSRKASWQGKSLTERMIKRIAEVAPETVIVSGLALGIDGAAHEAALKHGLKTLAVLGNGLSTVYPAVHKQLAAQIAAQGAILSEFPMKSRPQAQHFPLRNRIVSGVSHGVMVIEAGERSGASITANLALEQGREVFALPGAPDSAFSIGSNRMIQQGRAKLVIDIEDVFEELLPQWSRQTQSPVPSEDKVEMDPEESRILELLAKGPLHQDQIAQQLGVPIYQLLATLTGLQLKGVIINRAGGLFEVKNS